MLNGLLINAGEAPVKNIGDYIQSIAQLQFLEHYDVLVERELLSDIHSVDEIRLIMNGWFMRHPEKFPPASSIKPLFVSFHITPKIEKDFFTPKTVAYLKAHAPIGCRDLGTVDLMRKHDIDAYFSGCLTLTLGKKYKRKKITNDVIFVDPYYEYGCGAKGPWKHLKTLMLICRYYHKLKNLTKNFSPEFIGAPYRISPVLNKYAMAACFYHTYRSFFSDDILLSAKHIHHQVNQSDFTTEEEKLKYADYLLRTYSTSNMVITSRIHCALPCLGIGTPVIFVASDNLTRGSLRSSGRFGGLIDLLNVVTWTPRGLVNSCSRLQGINKITHSNTPINGNDYIELRDNLSSTINEFLTQTE